MYHGMYERSLVLLLRGNTNVCEIHLAFMRSDFMYHIVPDCTVRNPNKSYHKSQEEG